MPLLSRFRFRLSTLMMVVLTAASAAALFAKIHQHTPGGTLIGVRTDVSAVLVIAIALTALALGSWKEHSNVQIMLQMTLACVGCLVMIWIGEAQYERLFRYWFQGTFAATVVLPLMIRRYAKSEMPRGDRRERWKKTCEAVFFSFVNLMLVSVGGWFQAFVYFLGKGWLGL